DQILEGLRGRGLADFTKIDIGVVRGLAYYTGVVFEAFDRAGKLRAIAGGGRYDKLVSQMSEGAADLPALGFAMGDVVLGELINGTPAARKMMEQSIRLDHDIDLYVVIAKEDRRRDALKSIQELRN